MSAVRLVNHLEAAIMGEMRSGWNSRWQERQRCLAGVSSRGESSQYASRLTTRTSGADHWFARACRATPDLLLHIQGLAADCEARR